jgi:hypothetical protein
MQSRVLLHIICLHQFDESWEGAFGVHHLEYLVILAITPIVEQEGGDNVEGRGIIFLGGN